MEKPPNKSIHDDIRQYAGVADFLKRRYLNLAHWQTSLVRQLTTVLWTMAPQITLMP